MDLKNFRAHLRVLEREIGRQLASETGCCGVSLLQCHVLLEIESAGPVSLKQLEEHLEFDKAALSRTVESLVRGGLVFRRQDPEDRRYVRIGLTSEGSRRTAKINNLCTCSYRELFREIPQEKHETVLEGVAILARAMRRLRTGKGGGCSTPEEKT